MRFLTAVFCVSGLGKIFDCFVLCIRLRKGGGVGRGGTAAPSLCKPQVARPGEMFLGVNPFLPTVPTFAV